MWLRLPNKIGSWLTIAFVLSALGVSFSTQEADRIAKPPAAADNSLGSGQDAATPSVSGSVREDQNSGGPTIGSVLKATTRMVLVDAVVTDRSGKPVTGLKPDDFEIFENGKPQKIRAFGARERKPENSGTAPPRRVLEPGVFTNIPYFHAKDGPPTVVLVDALNTPVNDQPYMKEQLLRYLQTLGTERNLAIYTLGTRLRLLQDFTSDPSVLQGALKRFTVHSSAMNRDSDPTADAMLDNAPNLASWADLEQSIRDFQAQHDAFQMDLRVSMTMEALKQIARNLAGYAGRKNLVWLSEAFPLYVAPDTDLTNPFASQRQYADEIQSAATLLTDNQVAVYPVDARGLANLMPDASVSDNSLDRINRTQGGAGAAINSQLYKAYSSLQASHQAMADLAEQTGGRASFNRNDIDHAVALSIEDGSTYYSLGYYPEDKNWNGKFRKIEVKVKDKGLHVHSRRGYFATDIGPTANVDDKAGRRELMGALAMEAPMATTLPFAARVFAPTSEQPNVFINFGIDAHVVVFEPQKDNSRRAKLDFVTAVFDRKGKLVTTQDDTITATLKSDDYATVMKEGLQFRQKINLPPGTYILKFGVRDTRTNLIGTATGSIEVPPKS